MLYTAVPIEWIFEEDEAAPSKTREIEINGVKLIVAERDSSTYEIVQLISSNPSHYLDDHYQPGKTLSLRPLL
ncbi:YlzJ-like family protein [Pullulanibacillus sp. KACC 23026]|uniref:YlzJ-like family protein n=1 Tax=Pullulanibacillus sp. KACC 23026 TaxID=3028315 RepID=UPI0023B1585A|nr:YlzJ-like family protein [Pullulanibacillus sp. KACC 23026]WEG11565.1 YlzJ-like family protein [Pullulanibacillus sp. KACC 23026]